MAYRGTLKEKYYRSEGQYPKIVVPIRFFFMVLDKYYGSEGQYSKAWITKVQAFG
jgi:hypothetical protein